jgi:hypothetical protein
VAVRYSLTTVDLTLNFMMNIKLKCLVMTVLLMSAYCDCRATVLYVRFSPQEIIIGAESKRTLETGETVCVCKITRIGDTFVALAGLAEYGDFDPGEFAREAITPSQTLEASRMKFEQLIEQPLVDVLQKVRTKSPARYATFKQGAAVNMIFARFNDVPELAGTALTPRDTRDGSIVLDKRPITLIGNVKRSQRIAVGVSKRVELLLDRPSFWAKGTVAGIQRIIELSVEDNKEAGGPIDIVRITKGAAQWFPQEPVCDTKSRRVNEQPSSCNSSKTN